MSIEKALAEVIESRADKAEGFKKQLERHEAFKQRMDDAGVVPNKQEFSIPLIERIGFYQIQND